jgi:hypothetical protein
MSECEYDKDNLIKDIRLGLKAREFLASDLGVFLHQRSKDEVQEAFGEMENVDPHDFKKIESIQFRIKVAKSFQRWMSDALMNGDAAFGVYEALEAAEAGNEYGALSPEEQEEQEQS